MIILKSQLKQIIREEVYNLFLEEHKENINLLSEGLITEREYWKRIKDWAKRKGIPWATAAAIAAGCCCTFPAPGTPTARVAAQPCIFARPTVSVPPGPFCWPP